MGAEQALKGPIVGGKAPERTGGWLAVRSRGGVGGYAIGLLALVLAAAVALALAPFDVKSASLLLLGAVMMAAINLLVSQLRAARDRAGLGTGRAPDDLVEVQSAAATAQELQSEIATLDRLGLTLAGHLDLESVGQGGHRRRRRGHGRRVRGLPVPGCFRRLDPLCRGRSSGGLRRLPPVPGCRSLRIAVPGRRLAQRRPRLRPSLWPEPPVQADAARPPARTELSRGARALRHRRPCWAASSSDTRTRGPSTSATNA